MTKTSTRFLSFTLMLMLALVAVVGGGQLSALTPAANATDAQVDLRATLTAPSSGNAGEPFEVIGKVRNVSGDPAGGSTFVFEYERGTLEPKLECVASGGATCPAPSQINHTPSEGGTFGSFSATIVGLPVNGEITLKLSGLFTAETSTSSFTLRASPQSSAVDTDPASNTAIDNTVITNTPTSLRVTKIQNQDIVNSGQAREYTITYENTGAFATVATIEDVYKAHVSGVSAGLNAPVTVNVSTVCDASSTVTCPDVFTTGESFTKEIHQNGTGEIQIFKSSGYPISASDSTDNNPYDKTFKHVLIRPGKKLVLKTTVVETLQGCLSGGSQIQVENKAEAFHAAGVIFDYGYETDGKLGYINGVQCQGTTIAVTKSQDRPIVNSGETRVYTVTYENTGNIGASVNFLDSYTTQKPPHLQYTPVTVNGHVGSYLEGNSLLNYSIECVAGSSTAPCPPQFNGLEVSKTINQDNRDVEIYRSSAIPMNQSGYEGSFPNVFIPAGTKLVLRIPVTHTVQGCVKDSEYLGVTNDAWASQIPGSSVSFPTMLSGLDGLVKANQCQETTIKVTKTQDKQVVASGEERKYQVTYENTGAHNAQVVIWDEYTGVGGSLPVIEGQQTTSIGSATASTKFKVTCDESSTATCPTQDFNGTETPSSDSTNLFHYGDSLSSTYHPTPSSYFNSNPLSIPAGTKIVLNVEITQTMDSCYKDHAFVGVRNIAWVEQAKGSPVTVKPAHGQVDGAIFCKDVSSITTVPKQALSFGDSLSFSSRFTNDAGQVDVLPFSQMLPQRAVLSPEQAVKAGLVTNQAQTFSFSCFTGSGANGTPQPVACPSDLAYDASKHAITGTYRQPITAEGWFEVHTNTYAGFVAAPSASFNIKTEIGEVRGDVNIPQNNSVDTFELKNTQHTLSAIVTLNRTAPENINFKIKLYCEFQGDPNSQPAGFVKEVSSSISQNSSSKSLTLHSAYWTHDNCRAEIERGDPPAGYVWDDDAEWEQIKSQIKNHIVRDHTWTFPLKIAPAPAPFTPTLPLTGGTAAITFTILGTIAGGVALAVAYTRNRVVRRRQLPEVN